MTNPATGPAVAWIGYDAGIDRGVTARPVHAWTSSGLVERLAADPDWQAWWLTAPRRRLDLLPWYTRTEPAAPQVLVGRRAVRVEWRADGATWDGKDRTQLVASAVGDLTTMLEAVRRELQLAPLPPLPPVAEAPAALPDTMDTPSPPDPEQLAPFIAERAGVSLEFALRMLGR